jgi:SurA-like protein/parvulin-like peptidyl-prolyl cis-trans isomerase-like protein
MKNVRILLPLLALVALLAACGGGGGGGAGALNKDDVAVVGDQHITTQDLAAELQQAKQSYAQNRQSFPKEGTSAYETIKSQAITLLVQHAERQAEAKKMGLTVTDKEVQQRLDTIKKQYFAGKNGKIDEAKYQQQLAKAKLTDAQFQKDIRQQLLEEKLYKKLTADAKVTDAEALTYYQAHPDVYTQAKSRDVQYMLIKKKALAASLYAKLKANDSYANFCKLAKQYSGDPSTAKSCGKATFTQGQTVKAFDTVLFSQPTNVTHPPVYDATSYKAYFLIRPLKAAKPRSSTPFAQVKSSIKQTLLQQKQTDAVNKWSSTVQKQFCSGSQIKFQVGDEPNPGPCTSLTTSTPTTT